MREVTTRTAFSLFDIEGGTQPPKSEFKYAPQSGYIRFVQIRDFESDAHPTFIRDNKSWRYCKEEDTLIGRYGAAVGRICKGLSGAYNVALVKVVPRPGVNPDYLHYLLKSEFFQKPLLAASDRSAQAGFNKDDLKVIDLPFLPLSDQGAVAQLLRTLDEKIELNRRMNETLEGMAQAIFRDWFIDFGPTRRKAAGESDPVSVMGGLTADTVRAAELAALFPAIIGDDGLPEGWNSGTLHRLAFVNPESWKSKNHPAQVEYVDLSNTKGGVIEATAVLTWEEAPSRARRIARPGDTIVGTVRPGNGSYAYVDRNGYTASTGFAVLRPKQSIYTDAIYVAATAADNIARLANLADGHGGAYPAVNPDVVAATSFPVVSDDLLTAFSFFVSPMRARVEQAKRENRSLAETRDYLLPRLMSGAVRLATPVNQAGC